MPVKIDVQCLNEKVIEEVYEAVYEAVGRTLSPDMPWSITDYEQFVIRIAITEYLRRVM